MRIAIVGSGIAGLASAWLLSRDHEVVLFEADDRLGGHTHTHAIELQGRRYAVDTGFIVHNPAHYPLLTALFDELGVATQPTTMSFSVRNEASGLEYNATTLDSLFCQRRNLLSPRFWGMLRDLARFYREAPALLDQPGDGPTLGDYLEAGRYGALFRDDHLIPNPKSSLVFQAEDRVGLIGDPDDVNTAEEWLAGLVPSASDSA